MKFLIADSFTKALGKLTAQEQSAAKITVFDMQQDPSSPGLKFHRIEKSKDQNFWSVRSSRDIRIIVHKSANSFLVAYVDHHDNAYRWAERRRIEAHPKTGAAQIVEVRERVEEIAIPNYIQSAPGPEITPPTATPALLFAKLTDDDLLGIGVPEDWLADINQASEENFFELTDYIPSEAAEALLDFVSSGRLQVPAALAVGVDPFVHPDAQRRFRVLDDVEELERALEYPWDQWAIFLHPSQRQVVEQTFNGPARVSGSAGTGKTVVALHRAARILNTDTSAKVLLTTFSSPLSNALKHKLKMLTSASTYNAEATVLPFQGVAHELFTLAFGHTPRAASRSQIKTALTSVMASMDFSEFTSRFVLSEWVNVIDAWQIHTLEAYTNVPRLGRKNRLGAKQRERLWPIFIKTREVLFTQGLETWPSIFGKVESHFSSREHKPFSHVFVDEAQDLGVPELRMLAAISEATPDALFFAGDLGQRIFQEPFSWKALGVDVRGRSSTLKVNYRTSHQIRRTVDGLLPQVVRDVDGNEEDRSRTVSVFNGPDPEMQVCESSQDEQSSIANWISSIIKDGIEAEEIGIFVRSQNELGRARSAIIATGQVPLELSDRVENRTGRISMGTMHLAKGLEFKAVIVMACDDDVLPNQDRINSAADEGELDEVYDTERHLFYVACTRARDRLIVSGVGPTSEFFEDIFQS